MQFMSAQRKKIIQSRLMARGSLLMVSLLLLTGNAIAAPCYGTRMPLRKKIVAGMQAYSIIDRGLEQEFGSLRSNQYLFNLSYGAFDWLSVDLKIGMGNIKQHPQGADEIDYPSNFAGGYGYRIKFLDKKGFRGVFGFQHISVHPKSTHIGNDKHVGILDDWQHSLLFSKDIKKATLYLGTRLSRVDYIHWDVGARKRRMSDLTKGIGLILGADYSLTDNIWLNIEGQFIDGEAVALSINQRF